MPTDGTDYTNATDSVTINVEQATPTIDWANPASIVYGTLLSGAQLDATASWTVGGVNGIVAGTFTYSPSADTLLNTGNGQTLSASFAPTDSTDYSTATGQATVSVQQATPSFSGLTPSQAILSGIASIDLAGTIASNTSAIPPGSVSISIDGVTETATVQTDGSFNTAFNIQSIPASLTPYTITYAYTASTDFEAASDSSTSLTVFTASIATVSPNPRNTPVTNASLTISDPILTTTLTSADLSLTDNGGPNLITNSVSLTRIPGNAYLIGGLSALTASEGIYSLILNTSGLQDQGGNAITGSVSTSWLMDSTPPTSTVNALPAQTTSRSFTVSVSDSDPIGNNGGTPSGVASIAIYDSINDGPFTLWTTVTPASSSALFSGQAGNTYGFYSTATDNAGNVQPTPASAQQTVQILPPLSVSSITPVSPAPRNTDVPSIDVTFSLPINTSNLTAGALTLTDNGNPISLSGVSLTLVSGEEYTINGLAGLTTAQGSYTLTVNAADITDTFGNLGTGRLSTSWLMDTTAPTSHVVNSLGTTQTSDTFPVSVSFSDPAAPGGAAGPGDSSVDLYVSVNNGPFNLYQTQSLSPAASGSVTFTFNGQDRNLYAFHSVAHDAIGNTENKSSTAIEASTSVPDLNPPVTHVLASSPTYSWGPFPSSEFSGLTPSFYNSTTGVFTLNWAGADPDQNTGTPGGSIALVNVYVEVDGGSPTLVGQLNGGTPNASGVYSGSLSYNALADGQSHTYSFYSVGIDDELNTQYAPRVGPSSPDAMFTQTYSAPLAVSNLVVEKGIAERSFIQYLDVDFNQSISTNTVLQALQSGLAGSSASSYLQLLWFGEGLNGNSPSEGSVNLFGKGTSATVNLTGNDLSINLGPKGITSLLTEYHASGTGGPTTSFGDGWYALGINPTGGATSGPVFFETFFRLLGSATGDLTVTGPYTTDGTDANTVYHGNGESGPQLDADINGDGTVNPKDLTETASADGHSVGSTQPIESNFPQFQLFAGGGTAPGQVTGVTQSQVKALLPTAIDAWQAAGLNPADVIKLENEPVTTANLGTSILGLENSSGIMLNQTAAGYNWWTTASAIPLANEIDLLTVLEHELGHVIGLPDNAESSDIMDISLGLGVRRSPAAADLATIAGSSMPTVGASSAVAALPVPQQPALPSGSVSGATVDAALASIVGASTNNGDTSNPSTRPGILAVAMGPAHGPAAALRKREISAHVARPYPHRLAPSPFPRKTRGKGPSLATDPRFSETAGGSSE